MPGPDLVIATIPGVQQFITDSRSTADAHAASRIVSELTAAMRQVAQRTATVVLPSATGDHSADGLPNRVVALASAGTGTQLAKRMVEAANDSWRARRDAVARRLTDEDRQAWAKECEAATGFPVVQWVAVPAGPDGYREQWQRAGKALAARKRIRDFAAYDRRGRRPCALTGRWTVVDDRLARRLHVPLRRGEALSVPALVKRASRQVGGFPSTWSVATAPFRRDVVTAASREGKEATDLREAVAQLRSAVDIVKSHRVRSGDGRIPGVSSEDETLDWLANVEGAWLTPETWSPEALVRDNNLPEDTVPDSVATQGRQAATQLHKAAQAYNQATPEAEIAPLTPYLAVLAQDADRMGRRLGKFGHTNDPAAWHGEVSQALVRAAAEQRRVLESSQHLCRVVYAGGDDLLGFVPVRTALQAVREANRAYVDTVGDVLPGSTASTALVFFHASFPLRSALAAVRSLLHEAKEKRRPGLGLAVLRRGGQRVSVVRSWYADDPEPAHTPAVASVESLVAAAAQGLSGRLAERLERDR
ncbi:MAG TPA: type III-B CRISPR-associated protein Cas10/Cmr2, partial [Micromonosporaceae bacterium]|nr:type III-B CRISPR-associated protein Cas10/Cmr2 [Micromonosporaceae bacterium]